MTAPLRGECMSCCATGPLGCTWLCEACERIELDRIAIEAEVETLFEDRPTDDQRETGT